MQKTFVLLLAGICGAAGAQTPTTNPMPDGSRDMYVGLGASYSPRWDGAREHKTAALPVLQVQWSNGIFISGMSAGLHLSDNPAFEYGPLLTILPRRDESGLSGGLGGVSGTKTNTDLVPGGGIVPAVKASTGYSTWTKADALAADSLDGIEPIPTRVVAGAFFNYYLGQHVRLTNNVQYGAGRDRNGLRYTVDLQRVASEIAPHHSLSAAAGLSFVNGAYNDTYFGVHASVAAPLVGVDYKPGGGLKDVHANLRWNWSLSPSWMLTSLVHVSHLQGDAAKSPLVQRSTNTTVSTALAYRF